MPECVLDANVLVAWIDAADSLHGRASRLMKQLEHSRTAPLVVLDVLLSEAISVLCRRFRERRKSDDLPATLVALRSRVDRSAITWVAPDVERLYDDILALVSETKGRINFNDALVVLLQREGRIGPVATFDSGFDEIAGFVRVVEDDAT
jgi:predicted nucleic acid-binding protein